MRGGYDGTVRLVRGDEAGSAIVLGSDCLTLF